MVQTSEQSRVSSRAQARVGIALRYQPVGHAVGRWFLADVVCEPDEAPIYSQVLCDRHGKMDQQVAAVGKYRLCFAVPYFSFIRHSKLSLQRHAPECRADP